MRGVVWSAVTDDLGGLRPGSAPYRRLLVALFFIGVATFAQLYSPQGLLPLISADLDIPADQAALMISAATFGLALGVIPWSFAGDAWGRRRAMLLAIIGACVFAVLTVVVPSFEAALLMRFLEGFMLGGIPALALAYLNEEISAGAAAVAAGTYISGTTVGGLSGRIIAAPVGEQFGWELGILTVTALAVVCVVIFVRTAPASVHFTPARPRRPAVAVRALAGNLRSGPLLVIYLQGFLTMGGFVAMYNFLGFHLQAPPYLLPLWFVSLIFLAYLAGTLSSPRAGQLAARHGRKPVLVAGNLIMMVGTGLTLVPSVVVIISGMVLLTAGFFAAHAVAAGWSGARAVAGTAQSASLYNLGYYGGSSVFGFLGGSFLAIAGWLGTVGMVLALCGIATAAVIAFLPRD